MSVHSIRFESIDKIKPRNTGKSNIKCTYISVYRLLELIMCQHDYLFYENLWRG